MAYKITGSVLSIGQIQNIQGRTGNTFQKRDLVVTVRKFDPYTGVPTDDAGNTPKFSFMMDKCQQLDNIQIGDIVTIHFDIAGRSYQKDGITEYFTDIRPFRAEVVNKAHIANVQAQPNPIYQQQVNQPIQPQFETITGETDGLPF